MLALQLAYLALLAYVSYTDIRWRIIPNRVMYPALLVALAAMFVSPGWQAGLLGAAIAGGVFLLPVFLYGPERAGMGDVKLALLIGLVVGFPSVVYALFATFALAALFSLAGLLSGKLSRRTAIPYGPFLAIGGVVGLFFLEPYSF